MDDSDYLRLLTHQAEQANAFLSNARKWERERWVRSEEHTSELQSQSNLLCLLLLGLDFNFLYMRLPPKSTPFPYPPLFRSASPPGRTSQCLSLQCPQMGA